MAKTISNEDIAKLLRELAAVLEALGDNPFKIRAYKNAAETVEFLDESLVSIWERGDLEKVSGIGKAISEKLSDLFKTGKSEEIDRIKARVPAAMFVLLPLDGLGPKKAYRLTKEFNLVNPETVIQDLQALIQQDAIAQLEGFGQKSQAVIKKALERYSPEKEVRMRIDQADAIANEIIQYLKQSKHIEKISALGSLRRRKSTIGDIDLGLATSNKEAVVAHIEAYPGIVEIIASGGELVRFVHKSGQNVDIKILEASMWGALLQHFTGSKQHNVALRERALSMGLSLSEHGIKKVDRPQAQLSDKEKAEQKLITYADEADFYQAMKLDWIAPELREDTGEINLAEKSKLPDLIELGDIKGDFHTHTNYDWASSHDYGRNSAEELIQKAITLKYDYIGIGDHNPSTSGTTPKTINNIIQKRINYVNNIAEKYKRSIKVFNTLEVDIKPDGDLALSAKSCQMFDLLIVSIHSNLTFDKKTMTQRVLKALEYPKVKILGHPTGRLINKRDGYELEWSQIFKVCLEKNIALEINANPNRLDLNETWVKLCVQSNVPLIINTDTHDVAHMEFMKYGIDVARRGWAKKENVINTYDLKSLTKWIQS